MESNPVPALWGLSLGWAESESFTLVAISGLCLPRFTTQPSLTCQGAFLTSKGPAKSSTQQVEKKPRFPSLETCWDFYGLSPTPTSPST